MKKVVLGQAMRKIGLQPVRPIHITKHLSKGYNRDLNDDSNEAGREAAAYEFLELELKFFKKIVITNTRWSPVKDILWISVEEPFMIKNIYKAAAIVRNKDVRTIMYPPA